MKKIIKKVFGFIIIPLFKKYLSSVRYFKYKDIKVKILPGVFHPGFFFSTKILLKYLASEKLADLKFLELGAGSGLIAIFAAKKGASVTASDISPTAIENLKINTDLNEVTFEVIHSDLFEGINKTQFDLIVINPPYYPKTPREEKDFAWFCGENFEYFKTLFSQMEVYIHDNSKVIMILSEDCDLNQILEISDKNNFSMEQLEKSKHWGETNYLFQIKKIVPS
ncbi:MAG: methyltransferase [Ignavibacteria bacterium]|nr:methyltransferase [Ignavibacteria bacterium]